MKKASAFHEKAMIIAEQADRAKEAHDTETAQRLYRQAFELERSAALEFLRKTEVEPTRSVLFRSAASLALECAEFVEAERMIGHGLSAEPPVDTRIELRELYEQMHFRLFLQDSDVQLIEQQIVLSLWGDGVAPDFVPLREVMERLRKTERLIHRTAERKSGLQFSDQSDTTPEIRHRFPIYQRIQMAASYAVVLQVGQTDRQLAMPFAVDAADIVSEVIDCLALYARENVEALHERIQNPAYHRNFVSIANALYPKTPGIAGVGISGMTSDGTMTAIELITRPRIAIDKPREPQDERGEMLKIEGVLNYAKSAERTRKVKIKDDTGDSHTIDVPEGMMADVVRPHFDARVVADLIRLPRGKLLLVDVNAVNDDRPG